MRSFESLAKKGSIQVFKQALVRDIILSEICALEEQPNFWIPLSAIVACQTCTPAERIVAELYDRCMKPHVVNDVEDSGITGAEYWVQVYRNGRGLAFHVDKDEHAMKTRGEMINPVYSSVLYLTGGQGKKLQSPTVITDEHYDEETRRMVPVKFPTESCLVFPKANRYVVFDGRAGHGVLDVANDDYDNDDEGDHMEDVRVTFLVNWWKQRPEHVERDPAAGATSNDTEREERADLPEAWDAADAPGALQHRPAMKEPVYALTITKQYLSFNEPFMLDDFLREQSILCDDGKATPVVLRHSGVVMIPFRPEAAGGEARHLVDCALISEENHDVYM